MADRDDERATEGLKIRTDLQARFRTGPEAWFGWLFDRLAATVEMAGVGEASSRQVGRELRILELASGTGTLWASNAARIPGGWRVLLSDIAPAMVRETRGEFDAFAGNGNGLGFLVADVLAIPSADGTWDVVLANGVFDFLDTDARAAAFREVRRVLAPGGWLCSVTGGRGHLEELEALVRPFVPGADYGGDPDAFGLENGAEQLGEWYSGVTLFPYEDALIFRSPEPLLEYLLSEPQVEAQLDERGRAALARHVEEELARRGDIQATEKKGLFLARKA